MYAMEVGRYQHPELRTWSEVQDHSCYHTGVLSGVGRSDVVVCVVHVRVCV